MTGQLFTQYFLTDGIRHTSEWRASVEEPQAFSAFADAAARRFEAFGRYDSPNESVTEQDLIRPVLALLGWIDNLRGQGAARNQDIPIICCSPIPTPRPAPLAAAIPKRVTRTPC